MEERSEFLVSTSGRQPIRVEASNWISALGEGLRMLGIDEPMRRLACEVLPNGAVIARNVASGTGYVVRPAPPEVEEPDVEIVDEDGEASFEGDLVPEFADLTEELEGLEAVKNEELLVTLLQQVTRSSDPDTAWRTAIEVAQDLVPSESSAGMRLESDGALSFAVATGPHAGRLGAMLVPAGAGIAGFSVRNCTSVIVHDPANDPRFLTTVDQLTGYATRSLLCVPVSLGERVFGCIELLNAPADAPFSRVHLELVEMVAGALSQRLAVPE